MGSPRFGNICVQLYVIYYRQPARSSWQHSVVLPRKYHVTDVRGSGRMGGLKGSWRSLITDREILHVVSDNPGCLGMYYSEEVREIWNNSTTIIIYCRNKLRQSLLPIVYNVRLNRNSFVIVKIFLFLRKITYFYRVLFTYIYSGDPWLYNTIFCKQTFYTFSNTKWWLWGFDF